MKKKYMISILLLLVALLTMTMFTGCSSYDENMVIAANNIRKNGGNVVVSAGKIIADMALPIAGLMTNLSGEEIALANEKVRRAVCELGVPGDIEPFMNMAFVSLPVIPSLKMTPQGLVNVDKQERIPLYCD